jgi:hypothetical protein
MIFSDGSRIMGQQARSKCGTSDTPLGCCEVKFPTNAEFLAPQPLVWLKSPTDAEFYIWSTRSAVRTSDKCWVSDS